MSITKASTSEQPIHTSCFPERESKLKKSGRPYS